MKYNRNFILKIRKAILLVLIFAVFPAFMAFKFDRGCYTLCVAVNQHVVDYFDGADGYHAITRDGHFRVMDDDAPCTTFLFDTLLYSGGLRAMESIGDVVTIVTGNTGRIFRGFNTGYHNWARISSGTLVNLNAVDYARVGHFIFVAGDSGIVLKSTNEGLSFYRQITGTTLNLHEVICIDSSNVRIAGDSNLTLYTTNGGITWQQQFVQVIGENDNLLRVDLEAVYFINPNTGWLAGRDYIFRTTNMGAQWIMEYKQGQPYNNYTNSMYFYNKDSGIAVGNRGDIQFTVNGGIYWFYSPVMQNITTKNLNKFRYEPSFRKATVMGDSGIVIYIDSVILDVDPISNIVPKEFKLYQNYPNPFNPATKIAFNIPRLRGVSEGRGVFVSLKIFDILGHEVTTLINEQLKSGTYEAEWDSSNFPRGVYFYKLETEEFSDSKKMILLK